MTHSERIRAAAKAYREATDPADRDEKRELANDAAAMAIGAIADNLEAMTAPVEQTVSVREIQYVTGPDVEKMIASAIAQAADDFANASRRKKLRAARIAGSAVAVILGSDIFQQRMISAQIAGISLTMIAPSRSVRSWLKISAFQLNNANRPPISARISAQTAWT